MHVERILASKGSDVTTVNNDETIGKAAKILFDNRIGAVLVRNEGGSVEGVLSERDIIRGMAQIGAHCMEALVSDLMTRNVVYCLPEDNIDTIMSVMTEHRIRHLPVMRDDQLLGIISIGDVVKFRIEEIESEAAAMRQYIATA